jgi:heme-degrading monooxygenase HmoA
VTTVGDQKAVNVFRQHFNHPTVSANAAAPFSVMLDWRRLLKKQKTRETASGWNYLR